jgi:hypothetical protein
MTAELRRMASGWRDIRRLSDDDAAALIRQDRVDVVVDTALHLEGNRLLVLARKPAPVQVTFAGYPGSTGLAAIDYRLSDDYLDPPGRVGRCVRRDDLAHRPDVLVLRPARSTGCPGGASRCDREPRDIRLPQQLFEGERERAGVVGARAGAVPRSRLLLLAHAGTHRQRTLDAMGRFSIDPGRIEFADYRSRDAYLELFRRIDISLDTLPYNGHTTSLDSLWMGVPLVTLIGATVVGRAGYSQLANLGLPELVASNPDSLCGDRREPRRRPRAAFPLASHPAHAHGAIAHHGREAIRRERRARVSRHVATLVRKPGSLTTDQTLILQTRMRRNGRGGLLRWPDHYFVQRNVDLQWRLKQSGGRCDPPPSRNLNWRTTQWPRSIPPNR